MKVKQIEISDFSQLHKNLEFYRKNKRWLFRGHANPNWEIKPKIGRPPFSGVNEKLVFDSWKRRAVEFIKIKLESDWEWLSIAQHHGLATRLLDWSTNPLNALFFALREEYDGDSVLYAANFKYELNTQISPFDITEAGIYYPKGIAARIVRQGGIFTLHGNPKENFENNEKHLNDLHKIIIRKDYKKLLFAEISFYGINHATLFPDLDGLSAFVNWAVSSKEYYWPIDKKVL